MYLAAGREGYRGKVPLRVCAEKFGVCIQSVHALVKEIRDASDGTPEDECTL